MASSTPTDRLSPEEKHALNTRVLGIARLLPGDYVEWVVAYLPDLNYDYGRQKIKLVKGLHKSDLEITEALEAAARLHQDALASMKQLGQEARSRRAA